jgi:beta-glucosidase
MKSRLKPSIVALACVLALLAQGEARAAGDGWRCSGAPLVPSITTRPVERTEPPWQARLAEQDQALKATRFDLAFLGDSITQRWDPAAWRAAIGDRSAINLGFNGDRTETLLWRLRNGHLDGQLPRAFVLLIGTNNIGRHHPPEKVADGIRAILDLLRERVPDAPILLVGILPRDAAANTPFRRAVQQTNRLIARCADRRMIAYVDVGRDLLDAKGRLTKAVAPDQLHFSASGYALLVKALKPALDSLTKG